MQFGSRGDGKNSPLKGTGLIKKSRGEVTISNNGHSVMKNAMGKGEELVSKYWVHVK